MALLAIALVALGSRQYLGLTDNVLCMPLPRGWSHSVTFGGAPGQRAAPSLMIAQNFHL